MTKKLLFLSLLAATTAAQAQTTDTSRAQLLDEVVVTANKFPQKQSTTGKVISVINKEQIQRSEGRTLPQLLNEQAGITINGALSNLGTNQTVYMRGAASGRTLILIDGIPVTDPSFIQNEFDLNMLPLNNIERIEIARGAQSTLYGSDAVAGVINIITVKQNVDKPINVKATLAGGNYSTYRANAQVYGKVGKLSYNTGYARLQSKGFSAAYDSTDKGNFDNDGFTRNGVNASVQLQATDELSFRTFGQYTKYKTDLDNSLFSDEKDYTNTNRLLNTGAGFHYSKNRASVTGNYQYTENKRSYYNDSIDVQGFAKFSTDDYYSKSQFVELYSNIELGRNVSLLHGADYRFNNMNSKYSSVSSFGPFTSAFTDTSLSQSSLYTSVFVHDNLSKFNAELGGRLNVHSKYGSNYTYTFNPSYSFSNHFRVFGSVASGFKAPTLYQLYSSAGNQFLKPERSKTYEVGVQQTANIITTRLVYFHRDIKDGIDFNNITYKYFNNLDQKVDGGEIEIVARPSTNLTLTANYTYLHAKEQTQSRENFKDTTYQYLLRRPNHNANLTLSYKLNQGLYVSLNGKFVGKRYDAGGYDPISFTPLPDVMLQDYFILGAYAEYSFKNHYKVFVDAQNLLNKRFYDVRGYNSIPFIINGGVVLNW